MAESWLDRLDAGTALEIALGDTLMPGGLDAEPARQVSLQTIADDEELLPPTHDDEPMERSADQWMSAIAPSSPADGRGESP